MFDTGYSQKVSNDAPAPGVFSRDEHGQSAHASVDQRRLHARGLTDVHGVHAGHMGVTRPDAIVETGKFISEKLGSFLPGKKVEK